MITLRRRAAFIALATCVAVPAHAQTSRQNAELVTLDRPAAFEIAPNTGSLKESVQQLQHGRNCRTVRAELSRRERSALQLIRISLIVLLVPSAPDADAA